MSIPTTEKKVMEEYIRKTYILKTCDCDCELPVYEKIELINLNRDTPLKKYKEHGRGYCFDCEYEFEEDDDIYSGAIFGCLENLCEDCFEKGEEEIKISQCLGCDKNLGNNEEKFCSSIYGKIYCKDCFKKEVLDAEDSN